MADSILGLVFEIQADPSQAAAALQRFEEATGKSFDAAAQGPKELNTALLSNHQSVHLLAEEMGVHLPRAVVGAISEMLPGINAIGPALLAAFAIAEIPKFIGEVKDASEALGGYTKIVRDAEKADIDASTAALIHFTTIAEGSILIAQTNQALANLAAKQGNWQEEAKAAEKAMSDSKSILTSLLGPIGEVITLYRGYKAAVKETSDTESQAAQLRQRLAEQLDRMTHIQDEQHKKEAKSAKELAETKRKLAKQEWEDDQYIAESLEKWAKEDAAAEGRRLRQEAELNREVMEEKFRWEKEWDRILKQDAKEEAEALKQLNREMEKMPHNLAALGATLPTVIPKFNQWKLSVQQAKDIVKEFTAATAQSTLGMMVQGMIAGESFKKVAHEAIVSIEQQAVIQAVWEGAQGLAMEALALFTGNPKFQASADAHFLAAAVYGGIGGAAAGLAAATRGSGGGGGGSRSSYGPSGADGGGGSGASGIQPQTIASGAGGRFGEARVVVFGTDHELQNWVAGAINGAVQRGVTVTATSSQRGAPVGH